MIQIIILNEGIQIGHSYYPANSLSFQIKSSKIIEVSVVGSDKTIHSGEYTEWIDKDKNQYSSPEEVLNALITNNRSVVNKNTQFFDYSLLGNLIYQGEAIPGSISSDPVWIIKKFTYSILGKVTSVQWANGNCNAINIWDNRDSLSYS